MTACPRPTKAPGFALSIVAGNGIVRPATFDPFLASPGHLDRTLVLER